jgi:hypothetical protein
MVLIPSQGRYFYITPSILYLNYNNYETRN